MSKNYNDHSAEGNVLEKIIVRGGSRLVGNVRVEGAKNAVLPILAASLLASYGKSELTEVPALADVHTILEVLKSLNADVQLMSDENKVTIDASGTLHPEAPFEYVRKMRASILVMGPLLARCGHARVSLPGGCAIGSRPIEQHIHGFEKMGAVVKIENGYVEATVEGRLKGTTISLDTPSVGATENLMMAAALAVGTTVINNAACEPEIEDLADYMNAMGARVYGAGTPTIRVEGVPKMSGAMHEIIPDRIEAGTFMVAAAITGGDVFIENAIGAHMTAVIEKLREMGVTVIAADRGIRIIGAQEPLKRVDIQTSPHPGFPTDMQAQFMALALTCVGVSVITETVFENRFMHVGEFQRMNAQIKVNDRMAVVKGPCALQGAEVSSTDLRAAAALILAGLVAKGHTRVTELRHLDRGYVRFHEKLAELGAEIERVSHEDAEDVQITKAALYP